MIADDHIQLDDDGELLCPVCRDGGPSYLHHGRVVVYDKENECAPIVKRTVVKDGVAVTRRVRANECGNPSENRDGVAIEFDCEICGRLLELTIAQYKGRTLLRWRDSQEVTSP